MSNLIKRLRGIYPVGPIGNNGDPEFGYRTFGGLPAIHKEAADALELADKQIASLRAKVHLCAGYDKLSRNYELLAAAVNDDGDHCDDECDSMAHSDACNKAGTELVIRQKDRIAVLEAALRLIQNVTGDYYQGAGDFDKPGAVIKFSWDTCDRALLIAGDSVIGVDLAQPGRDRTTYKCLGCGDIDVFPDTHECPQSVPESGT